MAILEVHNIEKISNLQVLQGISFSLERRINGNYRFFRSGNHTAALPKLSRPDNGKIMVNNEVILTLWIHVPARKK